MFSNRTVTFLTQEALSYTQLSFLSHLLRNDLSCGVFSSQGLLGPEKVSPHDQITLFPPSCCYASKIMPLLCCRFLHVHSPMELNGFLLVSGPRIAQKTASLQSNTSSATTSMAIHLSHNNLSNSRNPLEELWGNSVSQAHEGVL